jgi:hypothetical protein
MVLISLRGSVKLRAIVGLEGLGKLKKKYPMTSSRIEPAIVKFVVKNEKLEH